MWDDINIETYIEIQRINEEEAGFSRVLDLLNLLEGEDYSKQDSEETILHFRDNFKWLKTEFKPNLIERVGEYRLKPLEKLNLAEWIDLESYISNRDYISLLSLIYRKVKIDDWGNIEYEPNIYSIKDRNIISSNFLVTEVLGAVLECIKYREDVVTQYKDVLISKGVDLTDEEKEDLTPQDIREIEDEIEKEKVKAKYSWHYFIENITGGNWSYTEDILKLNHLYVFNMLRMQKLFKVK